MEPLKEAAVFVNGNRLRHIHFRLTVNQRAILIEELVARRKFQCGNMIEGMVSELKKSGAHSSVVQFMEEIDSEISAMKIQVNERARTVSYQYLKEFTV